MRLASHLSLPLQPAVALTPDDIAPAAAPDDIAPAAAIATWRNTAATDVNQLGRA